MDSHGMTKKFYENRTAVTKIRRSRGKEMHLYILQALIDRQIVETAGIAKTKQFLSNAMPLN